VFKLMERENGHEGIVSSLNVSSQSSHLSEKWGRETENQKPAAIGNRKLVSDSTGKTAARKDVIAYRGGEIVPCCWKTRE